MPQCNNCDSSKRKAPVEEGSCPVCDTKPADHKVRIKFLNGQRLLFATKGCAKEFLKNTSKYVASSSANAPRTYATAKADDKCPVCVNPAQNQAFVQFKNGQHLFFACGGCARKFLANPKAYVAKKA